MISKLSKISLTVAVGLSALPTVQAHAADTGIYVGAAVGQADVSAEGDYSEFEGASFDDSDNGYKIFAGFNLGFIPLIDVSAEAAYVDFGEQEGSIAGITGNQLAVDAWAFSALAGTNLGPIGVFAKLGFASWDGDITSGADSLSDDGTDPLYGVGAKFQFGSMAVRGEYEVYDLDALEVDYLSVGLSYTF